MLLLTNRSHQPFLTLCAIHFPSTDQNYRPRISDIWRKKKFLFIGRTFCVTKMESSFFKENFTWIYKESVASF